MRYASASELHTIKCSVLLELDLTARENSLFCSVSLDNAGRDDPVQTVQQVMEQNTVHFNCFLYSAGAQFILYRGCVFKYKTNLLDFEILFK